MYVFIGFRLLVFMDMGIEDLGGDSDFAIRAVVPVLYCKVFGIF